MSLSGKRIVSGGVNTAKVSFSADGKRIINGPMKVWDAETGEEMLTLEGHMGQVYSVDFSPDGRQVVAGIGGTVWDAGPRNSELRAVAKAKAVDPAIPLQPAEAD